MKTIVRLTAVLLVFLVVIPFAHSQSKIILHHNGNASFFAAFESALSAAQNGDTVYLSGGLVNCSTSSPIINKRLHIIGTGHYPDSTVVGCTNFLSQVHINTGASLGSIQGCRFSQMLYFGTTTGTDSVHNFHLSRCRISAGFCLGATIPSNVTNLYISECVLEVVCIFNYATNCLLEKNVITSYNNCTYLQNSELKNNIIYGGWSFGSPTLNYNLLKNNVLINTGSNGIALQGSNEYLRNLFCTISSNSNYANVNWGSNVNSGNIIAQLASATFINALSSTFGYDNNYHLLAGCPGINYGDDGTDVGVYGTSTPYKEGAIPTNPHIVSKSINSGTNPATGFLHLDITVSAQSH